MKIADANVILRFCSIVHLVLHQMLPQADAHSPAIY